MRQFQFAALLTILLLSTGCATVKGWFGGSEDSSGIALPFTEKERAPRYSESPQMLAPANRQYRKMSRSRMEEESELHSQAGSMWVNEGQTSYLFVQNKSRREGDILNVKLEGSAMRQVETKVGVIKKLLKQLEEQQLQQQQQQQPNDPVQQQKMAESAPNGGAGRAPAAAPPKKEEPKEEKEDLTDIQSVPARIVERLPDGNYRVRGAQPFMIGKREYKVIVTGMIRPEDYNDEGVNSSKLLDPQYDVVSLRRTKTNE